MFLRKLIFTLCWRKCPFITTLLQKNYFSADSVEHTGKLSKVFESHHLSILMNITLLLDSLAFLDFFILDGKRTVPETYRNAYRAFLKTKIVAWCLRLLFKKCDNTRGEYHVFPALHTSWT